MSDHKPDEAEIIAHNIAVSIVARLINATSGYLDSPSDSLEEQMAERNLEALVQATVETLSPESMGAIIMTFTTLIVATVDEAEAQKWFDHQAEMVRSVLGQSE